MLEMLSAQPDTGQSHPAPADVLPAPKRKKQQGQALKRQDEEADELPFSIDFEPNSSPLRAGTFSPEFFKELRDELELSPSSPGMLQMDGEHCPSLSLPIPMGTFSSTMSTPDTCIETSDTRTAPLSLLEAVTSQTSAGQSRRSSVDMTLRERPPSPEVSMLQGHAQWQKKLRAAVVDSDAGTRALLSGAVGRDLYTTVQVLARLSPRQVETLHVPARTLVQQLLNHTREQVCQEAGLAQAEVWDLSPPQLLGQQTHTQTHTHLSGFGTFTSVSGAHIVSGGSSVEASTKRGKL